MPREPRMKLEKPSERIDKLSNIKFQRVKENESPQYNQYMNRTEAIICFLDEQYEKEWSIVGVGYDCLSTHGPNGYCENCQKYEENKCCEKCKSECWRDNTAYYFPCECHKESPQAKEKQRCDEKNCRFYCSKKLPGHDCYCHKEPVSERNDDDAKKCPYRIPDCPIDYPDVSERNALIDELVEDVEKKKGDDDAYPIWNDTLDDLVAVLKSKKK